jgi:hypothetical protein
MTSDYTPRLSINITDEQQQKISRYFPWGTQKKVFGVILNDLLDLCEKHGADKVIGALVARYISLNDVCKLGLKGK